MGQRAKGIGQGDGIRGGLAWERWAGRWGKELRGSGKEMGLGWFSLGVGGRGLGDGARSWSLLLSYTALGSQVADR